jgi:hypothetical protein
LRLWGKADSNQPAENRQIVTDGVEKGVVIIGES